MSQHGNCDFDHVIGNGIVASHESRQCSGALHQANARAGRGAKVQLRPLPCQSDDTVDVVDQQWIDADFSGFSGDLHDLFGRSRLLDFVELIFKFGLSAMHQ